METQTTYALVWDERNREYRAYPVKGTGSFSVSEREALVMVALKEAHYCE